LGRNEGEMGKISIKNLEGEIGGNLAVSGTLGGEERTVKTTVSPLDISYHPLK